MLTRTVDNVKLKKALANSVASARIEGFAMPDRHIKLAEAVVLGKLTKDECLKELLAKKV